MIAVVEDDHAVAIVDEQFRGVPECAVLSAMSAYDHRRLTNGVRHAHHRVVT